jgi:hypothetical protein
MRGRQSRKSTNHREGILRRVSVNNSKLVCNFKETNKKLIIVSGFEKPLKGLENHQRIHREYCLKCSDLQENIHLITLSFNNIQNLSRAMRYLAKERKHNLVENMTPYVV